MWDASKMLASTTKELQKITTLPKFKEIKYKYSDHIKYTHAKSYIYDMNTQLI